ncbi:transmembrane protein [Spiroplasma litorale]|uniref:Transmembrane protein n=1 Tax=Spiroplasma litorale TaxID=216942 RepID=A0A0K1W2Y4_9MOLU|nr:ECF transporter S component [Spiroplasma litorale]AKX34452.1 transmembrane protein [Spiroplasma litorale]
MNNNSNNNENNEKEHDVLEHNNDKNSKKDHYHEEHHYDIFGNHDDVKEDDFNWKTSIYTSKRNLTFRLTLSAMMLAIAIGATAMDMYIEHLIVPIDGVILPTRFLDILVITLSIGSLGPIFSSCIAFIVPWIHMLLHGGAIHNPLSSLVDAFGYFIFIWVLWFLYYFVFKNSYTHKHPNNKIDLIKRWVPMAAFVPVITIVFTMINVLIIYLNSGSGEELHDHEEHSVMKLINYLSEEEHEHEHHHANWTSFSNKLWTYTFIIFGIELARFTICYSLFGVLEPQMKKINHIYK